MPRRAFHGWVVILLLWASNAFAQPAREPPRVQVFGGYSYAVVDRVIRDSAGHGVAAGLHLGANRYFGVTADVDSAAFWTTAREMKIRVTFLSAGPRFSLQLERFTPFGFGTVDGQWSRYSDGHSASAVGLGLGGGLDVALSRRITLRALQVNRSLGGWGSGIGLKTRLKTGIVVGLD